MWYILHQQAQQLIADRELEAAQLRLARLAAGQVVDRPARSLAGSLRWHVARATLALGRTATRVAGAIDTDAVHAS